MKKLLVIAVLAIGFNAQSQNWVKVKNTDSEVKDVYHYVSHGDITAKKWTNISSGEKFTSSVSKTEYCTIWKVDYDNYASFFIDNSVVKVEEGREYNVTIIMEDDSVIKDLAEVYINKDSRSEFILNLNSEGINLLKTKTIKEFQIKITEQNFIVDSKENELDVDFIKKSANLIWP
jgi:hypothetical protein